MRFCSELIPATLIKRYKRFLADVRLGDGSITTIHVANPGSMMGLQAPDSVTDRGARHLDELATVAKAGARALMLFVIQIPSATSFDLARDIDPTYGAAFDRARAVGVETLAYVCRIDRDGVTLAHPVPI